MARTGRMVTASLVLATASAMAGRAAEAQLAPPSLTLVVRDYGALPPRVLERAKGLRDENLSQDRRSPGLAGC